VQLSRLGRPTPKEAPIQIDCSTIAIGRAGLRGSAEQTPRVRPGIAGRFWEQFSELLADAIARQCEGDWNDSSFGPIPIYLKSHPITDIPKKFPFVLAILKHFSSKL
jgi:hypothetical protein